MKSAFVGILSIIELKNARWNIENPFNLIFILGKSKKSQGEKSAKNYRVYNSESFPRKKQIWISWRTCC